MLIEKRMHEGAAFSPERKMKKRDFDLYITFFFKFLIVFTQCLLF
jgi:hypothetical protein